MNKKSPHTATTKAVIDDLVAAAIGDRLKCLYSFGAGEPLPRAFEVLLERLAQIEPGAIAERQVRTGAALPQCT